MRFLFLILAAISVVSAKYQMHPRLRQELDEADHVMNLHDPINQAEPQVKALNNYVYE